MTYTLTVSVRTEILTSITADTIGEAITKATNLRADGFNVLITLDN